jgi:hypothetical protein
MLILEGLVLNWLQYQISHGIALGQNTKSIVWMIMH